MKKKIIFITEALWVGGIESALCNLLNRLDYDRYEVTCLILRDSRELAERLPPQCRLIVADRQHAVSFPKMYRYKQLYNIMEEPQHAAKPRRFIWHMLRMLLRAPEARLYAAYIKEQLGCEHFDTAVIYSDRAAETAIRAVFADRFLMLYHHGAMRKEYHDAYGYRKAENIIAVSEAQAEKLRKYRPQYAKKIIAINNIIDVDTVRKKSTETPDKAYPKDGFNIVSCGRLSPAKGMDIAIDACARLVWDGLENIHWWIIGGGPEEAALRAQIRALGMENNVTLLGMQGNPYPYIRSADLYVQPSRFEGHCVTVLEARLLAVPILATGSAAAEQIEDGETGLLCDSDAASLADAVKRLYRAPELRQAFRDALRRYDFEHDNAAIMQKIYALL